MSARVREYSERGQRVARCEGVALFFFFFFLSDKARDKSKELLRKRQGGREGVTEGGRE